MNPKVIIDYIFQLSRNIQEGMENLKEKQRELVKEKEMLKIKINQIKFKPLLEKHIKQLCETAKKRLESLNFEEKKEIPQFLIDEIIFYSHQRKAIIKANIPLNLGKFTGIKSIKLLES